MNDLNLDYDKAFYIPGFEFNEKFYQEVKVSIRGGDFAKTMNNFQYNSQGDNIDFYLLSKNETYLLVAVCDYVDLWKNELVLDQFEIDSDFLSTISSRYIKRIL